MLRRAMNGVKYCAPGLTARDRGQRRVAAVLGYMRLLVRSLRLRHPAVFKAYSAAAEVLNDDCIESVRRYEYQMHRRQGTPLFVNGN